MRPSEVVRRGAEYLERHGVPSPEVNAERLMLTVLGTDRAALLARTDGLTTAEAKAYGRALCRRCTGTPLQHLTEDEGFRRLVLTVRTGVFVPRPETEVVVEAALGSIDELGSPLVVDLCTGAGTIALALADEHPGARVWATDVSAEAVALARENVGRLGLDVRVVQGDLFASIPSDLRGTVDLLTCNPPYVAEEAAAELSPEVLADPPDAVFGGPDVYARILPEAFEWLRPGGVAALEIEESLGETVTRIARRAGFEEVHVRPDLNGRDRVVVARRP